MDGVAQRLQPPAHSGSSLADFSTLKMEAIRSPKRRFTQDLHGATSQKTAFFDDNIYFFARYIVTNIITVITDAAYV
jgi:hypothetical protein